MKSIHVDGALLWKKAEQTEITILEYLQFNANMVFDTGVICTQDTKIEVNFTRESSTAQYLYGVRTTNNTASVTGYLTSSGAWRFGNTYRNATTSQNEDYTIVVSKSGLTINESSYKFVATVKNFTCPYTLTIGSARTTSGAKSSPQFVGKIYYFKMWDGDSLILDLVPASNSNGVHGFLDRVTNTFMAPM